MSCLQNESILETIYEDVIAEAIETDTLAMMSQSDIEFAVNQNLFGMLTLFK